jgi:GNAT superfamily N-acetyltransferase
MAQRPTIVALDANQDTRYNEFLRRAVREHPDTLRISEADILDNPFCVRAGDDDSTYVAVCSDGSWAGTVAVERERERTKRRHIAWIMRMYVAREHAGIGIGRALLERAIEWARALPEVTKVNLTVAAHNAPAIALYAHCGFREFSREPDAFRDTRPRTELSLSLHFG